MAAEDELRDIYAPSEGDVYGPVKREVGVWTLLGCVLAASVLMIVWSVLATWLMIWLAS